MTSTAPTDKVLSTLEHFKPKIDKSGDLSESVKQRIMKKKTGESEHHKEQRMQMIDELLRTASGSGRGAKHRWWMGQTM